MGKLLVGLGVWLISDAIFSYTLYVGSQSWRGTKQTWAKDHWVRLVRLICGVIIIIVGAKIV